MVESNGVEFHELSEKEMAKARADALAEILASHSARKLVVAGPGTGKTHTFLKLLSGTGDNNLALTFLRNLVSDLEESLQEVRPYTHFTVSRI